MILLLSRLTPDRVKSITPDRGSGFALYREFSAAAGTVPLYFANPHAPWQCGANENTSGLIRKCLPKGSDMGPASDKQIDSIIALLNLRAQKCLA